MIRRFREQDDRCAGSGGQFLNDPLRRRQRELAVFGERQITGPGVEKLNGRGARGNLCAKVKRGGARDFVQKPWDNDRLRTIVKTQIDLSNAIRRGLRLEAENRLLRAEGVPALIAESPAMQPVLQMISRVGPSDANVLITGEPGTGKEVIAKTLFAIFTPGIFLDASRSCEVPGLVLTKT